MNLLVITSVGLFPRTDSPTAGIFFANFLRALVPLIRRVVVVTPPPYVPGLLKRLRRFAPHRSLTPRDSYFGIKVYRPPFLSTRCVRRQWHQARAFSQAALPLCRALHRQWRFDIVLGSGLDLPGHAAQVVAHSLGLRSVAWGIGSDVHKLPRYSADNARLIAHSVRHNTMVLAVSDSIRRLILKYRPSARNVHTFYRGIDLTGLREPVDRAAMRARLGLTPERTYVIAVAELLKTKGAYEFYDAFKQHAGTRPEFSAIWVGGGPEGPAIRALARRDGLSARFSITGPLPRPDALRYFHAADLLAFPTHAEGLSNAVMEALAAGLPTVTTDVGGHREVLVDGVTGLLVPPRNVPALVQAIDRVLENPVWALRMAERGRRLILDHFDVARNAAVAKSILCHVAEGGDPTLAVAPCAGISPGRLPMDEL